MGMKTIGLFFMICLFTGQLLGQSQPDNKTTGTNKLKVYFDCPGCDMDYIKQEIGFVDNSKNPWVSNRDISCTAKSLKRLFTVFEFF